VAVRSKASDRQMATRVRVEAGGVIRHQQRRRRPRQSAAEATGVNRRQRTKTSRLRSLTVCPFAHICSSSNFGSRNFSSRNFFRDSSRSRLVNIPTAISILLQLIASRPHLPLQVSFSSVSWSSSFSVAFWQCSTCLAMLSLLRLSV